MHDAGKALDYAREAAAEAGYLPQDSTIDDLYQALGQEFRGNPVYSSADAGLVEERRATTLEVTDRSEMEHYAERLGIPSVAIGRMDDGELAGAIAYEMEAQATTETGDIDAETVEDEIDRQVGDYERDPDFAEAVSFSEATPKAPRAGVQAGSAGRPQGQASALDQDAEIGGADAREGQIQAELTPEGVQTVIPGAERISDRELAERKMQGRQEATKPQKAADDGLFDVAGRGQGDLLDAIQKTKGSGGGVRGMRAQASFDPGDKYVGFRPQPYNPDQDPLPKGKAPITREAVIAPLLKDLGMPLYQGRVKGERLGFFQPWNEAVRVKKHGDLEVTAHELAHLLDKRFPEIRRQWLPGTKNNKAIREELKGVSYDKDKLYEGFTEFVRLWATQRDQAQAKAPLLYDWFEGFLEGNRHGPAMRQAQQQMHAWFEQTAIDRARSKIGLDLHRKSGEHQLKQEVFDGTRDQVYGGVQARGGAPGSDQWPATG